MTAHIQRQPIQIKASSDDREGVLLLANDELVAVLARLSPNSGHGPELWHKWFLETGYGPCADMPNARVFDTVEAAEAWVAQSLAQAERTGSGVHPVP